MSFGGGGSGALPNHEHTNIALDGGPLDFVNTTIASLSAGSVTYSSGAALQELTIGGAGTVLGSDGAAPAWVANTANPLIKVTKTFADIVIAGTSMDIYELPQDAAAVNIWADITTAFDISTGVSIGDGSDDNGFAEATDWTAGTGLTDATRGAYVTSFKTMRSTTGTTDIKAYNFSTAGGTGTTFEQLLTNRVDTLGAAIRQEFAQQFNTGHVLVGENIANASFWLNVNTLSPTGDITAYIRQSDGTIIQTSSTTLDASTVTGSMVEYHFDFPNTTLAASDMITLSCASVVGGQIGIQLQETEMTNGKLYESYSAGSAYSQVVGRELTMTVEYDVSAVTTDTQGEVDFYLQVVD